MSTGGWFPRFTDERGEPVDDWTQLLVIEACLDRYEARVAENEALEQQRADARAEAERLLEQQKASGGG